MFLFYWKSLVVQESPCSGYDRWLLCSHTPGARSLTRSQGSFRPMMLFSSPLQGLGLGWGLPSSTVSGLLLRLLQKGLPLPLPFPLLEVAVPSVLPATWSSLVIHSSSPWKAPILSSVSRASLQVCAEKPTSLGEASYFTENISCRETRPWAVQGSAQINSR